MAVRRSRDGTFRIRLSQEERGLLRSLPGQLRELLGSDHPALKRLFPPAYEDDPAAAEEYDRLMRSDLLQTHHGNLEILEATAEATNLDGEQLDAWLGAVNALRLTLGTQLEVTEEMDWRAIDPQDPRLPGYAVYLALTRIAGEIVDAIMAGIDPAGHPGAEPPPGG